MGERGFDEDLSHSALVGSEDRHEFFCQPCDVDGDHVEAMSFCEQCEEYLCTNCAAFHRKQKQMRDHALQDVQLMTNKPPVSYYSFNSMEECQDHPGKLIEYVCNDHGALGCQACMTIEHTACTKLFIPKISKGFTDSQDYKQFRTKLIEVDKNPEQLNSVIDKQRKASHAEHSKVKTMVKEERADMDRRLDKWEKDMYSAIDNSRTTTEASLLAAAGTFKQVQQEVTTMSRQLDQFQESKQDSNLYIAVIRSQSKVAALDQKLTKAGANTSLSRPVFRPNRSLNQPDALGQIVMQEDEVIGQAHAATLTKLDTAITDKAEQPAPTKTATMVTHLKDIEIGDNVWIISSAIMSRNQLLVADYNKVRLLDTDSGRQVSELKLPASPGQVTRMNDTEAAVTLPENNNIILLRTQPWLSEFRRIRVQGVCYGIAYMDNRLIVTFYGTKNATNAAILDLFGNVLRTISADQTGKKIFNDPSHVTADSVTGMMYVSDSSWPEYDGKVVKLSKEGVVLATYKSDDFGDPFEIAVGTEGNVYIVYMTCEDRCEHEGRVEQLSANSDTMRAIIRLPVIDPAPRALSYDEATQQLYVGQDRGVVKVYRLS